jgi:uncharacterized integral membrane protein (TIGR00698 family)
VSRNLIAKLLFLIGLVGSVSGWVSPPVALGLGLAFGLTFEHPYPLSSRQVAKLLLQASVVALGFGMDLRDVLRAGRAGFMYTATGIALALLLGLWIGKMLRVGKTASFLIATGTAICGGSAIAAVAPIVQAAEQEIAVSLGTVFILNSVTLLLFPAIGWALRLSQEQFGLWAALAIHDTSSVVGATARYGAVALVIGTTVKLARALWIVPLAMATAARNKTKGPIQWPWFILLFCLAVVVNTYLPQASKFTNMLSRLGKVGLTATLYLIGTGISVKTVRQTGVRPFLQGVLLWIMVAVISLALILKAGISF